MEVEEEEKIVIAKPVASRPTCSKFRSFSELLAGTISEAPSSPCYETTATAVRPRSIRFKPALENASAGIVSSQANFAEDEVQGLPGESSKSERATTRIHKPIARVVSKRTASLLAKLDSAQAKVEIPISGKHTFDIGPENLSTFMPQLSNGRIVENLSMQPANTGQHQGSVPQTTGGDRSCDGYNWRKYGQKQVKGSEYPRSYYKCTHPNCPVKKKVERSLDGQIAEIVYKGEHNHSKPQLTKRNSHDGPSQGNAGIESGPLYSSQLGDRNEGPEGNIGSMTQYGLSAHSSKSRKDILLYGPNKTGASAIGVSSLDHHSGQNGEFDEGSNCVDIDNHGTKQKARQNELHRDKTDLPLEATNDPAVGNQTSIDSEIVSDGFLWRKYGQKVVKGNSYPRSYYKCKNLKCNVRKYVERTSADPNAFITTYEGKHNH